VVGAVSIGREVAPRFDERCANRPAIRHRIVDIHLVRRIWGLSAATDYIHRVAEVKPSRFSRGTRDGGNVTNGIGHRIVNKREVAIMKQGAIIGAATASVNKVADGSLRNVTERRRQVGVLVGPYQRDGVELPDVVVHRHIYVKSA